MRRNPASPGVVFLAIRWKLRMNSARNCCKSAMWLGMMGESFAECGLPLPDIVARYTIQRFRRPTAVRVEPEAANDPKKPAGRHSGRLARRTVHAGPRGKRLSG